MNVTIRTRLIVAAIGIGTLGAQHDSNGAPESSMPSSTQASITFRDSVVLGERLFLRDIASCENRQGLCDELNGIDLGPSPQPGKIKSLPRATLEDVLRREVSTIEFVASGPDEIRVETPGFGLDPARVSDVILSRIRECAQGLTDVTVDAFKVSWVGGVVTRTPDASVECVDEAAFEDGVCSEEELRQFFVGDRTYKLVAVDRLPNDESASTEVKVRGHAVIRKKLPVLKTSRASSGPVALEDLSFVYVPLPRNAEAVATHLDEILGKRVTATMLPNKPIPKSVIQRDIAVRRNQALTLHLRRGGVAVGTQVRAVGEGVVGDEIEVEYAGTKKRIQARIMGAGDVEVQM